MITGWACKTAIIDLTLFTVFFNGLSYANWRLFYTEKTRYKSLMSVSLLNRGGKPALAYAYTPPRPHTSAPLVMFCGGYRSDMNGTKALYLEAQCRARGQAYLRFDYSGHGQSGGVFSNGTIGDWAQDSADILSAVHPDGPVLLVGSSMGGWMALLLALRQPKRIAGIIGIAAAPDFTDDLFEHRLSPAQKLALFRDGIVHVENDYSDEPYIFTCRFYEEARQHRILDQPRACSFPLVLIQGKQDADVDWRTAETIKQRFESPVEIVYIEDGDHRLSRPQDLALIDEKIRLLSGL
jgi:pimeloyl-ACP methyl ester carboxylesterase